MNLWEIQPFVAGRLTASSTLTGIDVLQDDGTYPKTPLREEKLQTKGLVLIVWEIDSEGLVDVAQTGFGVHDIYVPVVVEENVKVNRSDTGTKIPALKALQFTLTAVSGQRSSPASRHVFLPMDPPFKNFGKVNGINRLVANFVLRTNITPA